MHKSGFVNIIGRPNVGKSTLMNELVGERMSIISYKPQTTRHRIIGLVSGEDFQIVFSDTPGIINDPAYKMQSAMNSFVFGSFADADIMMLVVDVKEEYESDHPIFKKIAKLDVPKFLILNKIDLISEQELDELERKWASIFDFDKVFKVSALNKIGTNELYDYIKTNLPEGPAYYPKDQLSDKPERFFVSEIIREKIFLQYKQEIPYSCEVVIQKFEVDENSRKNIIRIFAEIYVSRKTQKSIIIGKGGQSIKNLGIAARKDIEEFLDNQVFLELYVKVKDNWRDDDRMLKSFGYNQN
jgi:GTP-binding protein Era